jgi:hypothetical protein
VHVSLAVPEHCVPIDVFFHVWVQWMTAGRGVVHAEMLGGEGVQRGISIWINLSSKAKMYVLLHHLSCLEPRKLNQFSSSCES